MIPLYDVFRKKQFITRSRSLRSLFLCKCVSRARDRWRTPCRGTLNCFLYNIQILWRFFFFPSVFVAEAGAGGVPGGLIKNPTAVTACSIGIGEYIEITKRSLLPSPCFIDSFAIYIEVLLNIKLKLYCYLRCFWYTLLIFILKFEIVKIADMTGKTKS